jgi:hypothetical protein
MHNSFRFPGLLVLAFLSSLPFTASADNATTEASYGNWAVFRATDPMNDKSWYGAVLRSDAGDATLQVDCQPYLPTRLNASFRFKEYIGGDSSDLTYRVDKNTAHDITASVHEKDASLLCEGRCTADSNAPRPDVKLIGELRNGQTLLVRIRDFRYNQITVAYSVDHSGEAFDHVLRGCAELSAQYKKK